jgi:GntR family transcriptional regulator, rspAB operon transcriptional repressor
VTKLQKLPRQRASDSVYEALRHAILSSAFQPGQRLNVHDLAEQLGVSLTPVKDAVTRLEAEALIEVRPRSGTFVTAVSPEDIRETFEIRCALECLAGEKAAANAGPDDVARLRGIADSIAHPSDDGTHGASNVEFHKCIIDLAGSERLKDIYQTLDAHIQIARIHLGHRDWTKRLEHEHREHLAIVDAIAARDREAVTIALRTHILRAAESLVRDLREARGQAASSSEAAS